MPIECSGCFTYIPPCTNCRQCGKEYTLEPKFQVGDKVRSVVGTVKRIAKNPDGTDLVVYTNDRGAERFLNGYELELVERPVKYKPGDKFLNFNKPMIYLEHRPDGMHRLFSCLSKNVQGFSDISHMIKVDSFD